MSEQIEWVTQPNVTAYSFLSPCAMTCESCGKTEQVIVSRYRGDEGILCRSCGKQFGGN